MEFLIEIEIEILIIDNYVFIMEIWIYCYINFVFDYFFSGFRI